MKVIADSSVLISLTAISQLELLRRRFPEVMIPRAVQEEVVIEGKGKPGSQEVQSSNGCLKVIDKFQLPKASLLA